MKQLIKYAILGAVLGTSIGIGIVILILK